MLFYYSSTCINVIIIEIQFKRKIVPKRNGLVAIISNFYLTHISVLENVLTLKFLCKLCFQFFIDLTIIIQNLLCV